MEFSDKIEVAVNNVARALEDIGVYVEEMQIGVLPAVDATDDDAMARFFEGFDPNKDLSELVDDGVFTMNADVLASVRKVAFTDRVLSPEEYEIGVEIRKSSSGVRAEIDRILDEYSEDGD